MAKTLKAGELAKALNISAAHITMAVKRGSIIKNDKNTIDVDHAFNKLWIQKKIEQGCEFDINRIYIKDSIKKPAQIRQKRNKKEVTEKKEKGKLIEVDDPLDDYARDKALHELKLLKNKALIEELKVAKMEGQLIPTDSVTDIVIWVIDTFHNTYQQEVKNLAETLVQVLGGDHSQLIEVRKDLTDSLKRQKQEAKENLKNGIEGIIEEYQEVRGRGERK